VQSTAEQLRLFSDSDAPGVPPAFSVRVSTRARRLSIKVFPRGHVEIVVPKRTRARDVQAFVEEHREWIERSRESFARIVVPEPFVLPDRTELRAIGQRYRIRYERRSEVAGVRYRCRDNVVVLSGRTDDEALCVSALKRWLASVARSEFAPRLTALSVLTDSPYRAMHIRGQRSCWGSHSSSGTISVNYCLLFLEPALLRYLMVHELCHARHMNHSRRFWQRVGRFEPEYRRLDKALGDAWTQIPTWVGLY
jgi:predicted metal-dependent hydrolase